MVIVGILLVVALWSHCDDTVVTVMVTMFIVVALWSYCGHCGGNVVNCGDNMFVAVALQ